MTVLLVGADRMEFQGLGREFGPPIRLRWPIDHSVSYDRAGTRLIAVANGAGPVLAAEAAKTALDREPVHAVVSVGFCGGLLVFRRSICLWTTSSAWFAVPASRSFILRCRVSGFSN